MEKCNCRKSNKRKQSLSNNALSNYIKQLKMGTKQENGEMLLKRLFPNGEKIWVQIDVINQEKCWKLFRFQMPTEKKNELGFDVSAIGVKGSESPQFRGFYDLKLKVIELKLDTEKEELLITSINDEIRRLERIYIQH